MDHSISANLAVDYVGPGVPPVSDRRWFGNETAKYGVSFDFDKRGRSEVIPMKAEADFCKNRKSTDSGSNRQMSGDRVTWRSDKEWEF